jgi:hypothetical protein
MNNCQCVPLLAALGLLAALAGGCSSSDVLPSPAQPQQAAVVCDGNPNWCAILTNEIEIDTGLYIDGIKVADAGPRLSVRVPVPAGETHLVNYCRYLKDNHLFGLYSETKTRCRVPESVLFDKNKTIVIYDRGIE